MQLICLLLPLCHFHVAKNLKPMNSRHALLKCQKGGGNHIFFLQTLAVVTNNLGLLWLYLLSIRTQHIEKTTNRCLQLQQENVNYTCKYVYIYIYTYMCAYRHTHTYICIHMLTHRDSGNNRIPTP